MKKEKSCGVIAVHNGQVLMVQQNSGLYGFPKGHVEKGENEIETAIRETKEETNVDVVIDEKKRFSISYSPKEGVLKDVIYFLAKPISDHIKPQEGEIKKVLWVDFDKVNGLLEFDNKKNIWDQVLNKYLKISQ